MSDTEVLDAIRDLGGQATAGQVIDALGITEERAEAGVLTTMGRLLQQGKLVRGKHTSAGRLYCLADGAA